MHDIPERKARFTTKLVIGVLFMAFGVAFLLHNLNILDVDRSLRFWPLAHYPHLVFYVERPEHIDVWRVLHGQRDIPAWMQEPDTF